ncbi:MAG: hypothetical protein AABN95_27445 [Acidobacteriota bacterium]
MPIRLNEDRRFTPRFRVWATCSLVPRLSDEDRRQHAVLGYVKDLNREAVAVLLPSHETYGVNASTLGRQVELTLGLPIGYLKLSATIVRHEADESDKQHLVVFRIEKSKERSKYYDFVNALEADSP